MNIYVELNKVIKYIEDNLEENIDYKKLSKMIGINEYTFQKVFLLLSNISISEYIRNRRLSNAGQDIFLKNEKIIDIAMRYQYGNSTSFSRAFEKFHGIKPSEARKNPKKLKIFAKIHFNEINEPNKSIEYKIIEKEQLILYGKYKITTNKKIKNDAPNFFKQIEKQYGEAQYGMIEYKEKERINVKSYWVLYNKEIEKLEKIIIPKSKYILIKINSQEEKDIQKASDIFYQDFFPSCKYNFRDLPELEYYHDGITDFLIPIEY